MSFFKSFFIFLTVLCISVFPLHYVYADAAFVVYSQLPEPVPSHDIIYSVFTKPSTGTSWLISISVPGLTADDGVLFYLDLEAGYIKFNIVSDSDTGLTAYLNMYNAVTGAYFYSTHQTLNLGVTSFNLPGFPFSEYSAYYPIGCTVMGNNPDMTLSSISWNDSIDPSTYTTWLESIYSKLGEVDLNTDSLESQLTSINSQLTLFYNLFNSYQMQQHTDLVNLYNKVVDIYNVLTEEQETYAPIEQESQINDYIQAEEDI